MFLIKKFTYITLIFLVMVFNTNANDELTKGMQAPDFTLVDQDNIKRSLQIIVANGSFYIFIQKMIRLVAQRKLVPLETI